jgi:YD repeat-containing protein
MGRMTSVKDADSKTTTYTYDANGNRSGIDFGNYT